jgi:hypothetical protein
MDREDFETSQARARKAMTRPRVSGPTIRDFKFITGRWCWLPDRSESVLPIWNPEGGPANSAFQRKVYWLCMGWSRMEMLAGDDPRVQLQRGSHL